MQATLRAKVGLGLGGPSYLPQGLGVLSGSIIPSTFLPWACVSNFMSLSTSEALCRGVWILIGRRKEESKLTCIEHLPEEVKNSNSYKKDKKKSKTLLNISCMSFAGGKKGHCFRAT